MWSIKSSEKGKKGAQRGGVRGVVGWQKECREEAYEGLLWRRHG